LALTRRGEAILEKGDLNLMERDAYNNTGMSKKIAIVRSRRKGREREGPEGCRGKTGSPAAKEIRLQTKSFAKTTWTQEMKE